MSRHEKTIEAMRNNPRDWRISDLLAVAMELGIVCRNSGGSHHVFKYPGHKMNLSVPAHRPIKPSYVRHFLELVDAVRELQRD